MHVKPIKRITGGAVQYDGAGVKLVRVIGYHDVQEFDPFLMIFGQLVGLVLAILLIFCSIGLALLVIRRLYRRLYHR